MKGQVTAAGLLEDLSRQADAAEIYEVDSQQLPVRFRAGALESVKAIETAGRALRVIQDGRLGFSTTTDLADGTTVVENALQSAQFGDPATFRFPARRPSQAVECFDPAVERLDEEQLIALGEEIVERLSGYDPELQVDVSLDREIERVHLLNTSGLDLGDQRTSVTISVEVTRAREGDILIVYDSASSRRAKDVDGVALAEGIVRRLRWAERTAEAPSRAMPVVFQCLGVAPLILPLMSGLNGRNVFLGTSPLGERLSQQAFDRRLTLVDDGRLDFAARSVPYDDEGSPTAERPLVEGGVVRQFLYDLKTAAQAGAQPTGNGFKSGGLASSGDFRQPPDVAPTNWLIPPGEHSLEQILQELDEALLVEQVIGLGQGNVLAGEFSNNVSVGFLVRRGEVVGRVKNTMIAGNVYDLLKDQLIALGNRPEWIFGLLRAPAIATDGVSVVGQG